MSDTTIAHQTRMADATLAHETRMADATIAHKTRIADATIAHKTRMTNGTLHIRPRIYLRVNGFCELFTYRRTGFCCMSTPATPLGKRRENSDTRESETRAKGRHARRSQEGSDIDMKETIKRI